MQEPIEVLNNYEKEVIKLWRDSISLESVASKMELPVYLISNTINRLCGELKVKCKLGIRKTKSDYFHAMCPRCCTRTISTGGQFCYCEKCSPKHTGVGSNSGKLNDIHHDIDAYKPSWLSQ